MLLSAASLLTLAAAPAQYLGRQHDDIINVVAALSLVSGRYELITSPFTPAGSLPLPGFPLLLAPLAWLAGDRGGLYQAFCALILAGLPWTVYLWLRRRLEPSAALLVSLLAATSPLTLSQAGVVMPEGAYAVLCLGLLVWLGSPQASRRCGWTGAALAALTQLRPAGISLLPAVLAGPLAARRWKEAAWTALPPIVGLGGWVAWSSARGGPQEAGEIAEAYGGRSPEDLIRLAAENAQFYLSSLGAALLPAGDPSGAPATILGAGLAAAALVGGLKVWRRSRWDAGLWTLGTAAVMHLAWGWRYERYLLPVIPIVWWLAAEAFGRIRLPALVLCLGLQCLRLPAIVAGSPWARPELERTYSWIRAHAPSGSVLASPLYVRDAYYCGMPSVPLPSAADPAGFAGWLRRARVTHILWQAGLDVGVSLPDSSLRVDRLNQAQAHLGDGRFFQLAYEERRERARVYRLREEAPPIPVRRKR